MNTIKEKEKELQTLAAERTRKQQERAQRAREETRRRAPGLSEGGDILMPTKIVSESNLTTLSAENSLSETARELAEKINYSDFEHGLSPADPWESSLQNDDLGALREIMGSSANGPKIVKKVGYVCSRVG